MFESKAIVRMYDTDMAGILYFGNQFRFAHDAFEELMAREGYTFHRLLKKETFIFVIVHAESDYLAPLYSGDVLTIHTHVSHVGTTSFSLNYALFKDDHLVGRCKTVHVCLDKQSRIKREIPDVFRPILKRYSK